MHDWYALIVSEKFQSTFVGAMAIADLVKTTLGPKGMVNNQLIIG
jgi:chaperonin GroEL (HSP60 family)